MLSFKTIRIDNISQVSDEDISHENLEYMHGTGIAISTGRDRMGEKKYRYRHGVQTALGDIEDERDTVCIFYTENRRREAIEMAAAIRKEGGKAVIQHVNDVRNMDTFMKGFSRVEYLIGGRKGEQA